MSELVQLISCVWLVFQDECYSFTKLKEIVRSQIFQQPIHMLKVCVPSLVYVVRNNLLYLAVTHLDAPKYQVKFSESQKYFYYYCKRFFFQQSACQLQTVTAALFSLIILKRPIISYQEGPLMLLASGAVMVQLKRNRRI